MWIKRVTIIIGLLATFAGIVPLVSKSLSVTKNVPKLTHKIARGDLSVTVTENGTVESSNNKEIKCFVKGGSTVLWVIETGTIVKPGDELVRLDTSIIEENITRQQIAYERAVANQIIAQSEVDVARTNIEEYEKGTYLEERNTIEKTIFDAKEQVKKAQLVYESSERMAAKGMFGSLQLEGQQYAVESARKDLQLKEQQLETLDLFKKKKTMQGLVSALAAAEARLAAEEASLRLESDRLERDKEQLANCVIKSQAEGMVIFPSAAEWKETPDIEEGAVVREQQTLLMIPDVTKMQVKVGIHESKVDKLHVGMPARIQLQDLTLQGEVHSIAEVTRPAGWWTGNMVKYDTLIKISPRPGLKPGMSAVVDVILAEHKDVLKIPVAAIVQSDKEFLCWVQSGQDVQRRAIQLGDSNDEFTVVTAGLAEGDEVVLNPLAFIDDAQKAALRPAKSSITEEKQADQDDKKKGKTADNGREKAKESGDAEVSAAKLTDQSQLSGAKIVSLGDKNGDGLLTEDEFAEQDRASFSQVDANGDGNVDADEIDAKIKAAQG